MSVDWCEELAKLETEEAEEAACGCPVPFMPTMLQQSFIGKALSVALSILANRGQARIRSYGGYKPRREGVCHDYPKNCNPMRGGEGCRKHKRYCAIKDAFIIKGGRMTKKVKPEFRMMILNSLLTRGSYG
jgi:hypothetical protein